MNELELTQKQQTIVTAIENMMRVACNEGIGFACDEFGHIYAYDATNVLCFDAPRNATYEKRLVVQAEDLRNLRYGRMDFIPSCEDVFVGMTAEP